MDVDIKPMRDKWRQDAEKLDRDYYALRAYFDKHRKCSCCYVDECKHFDRALRRVLGERADELMRRSLTFGLIAHGIRLE